MRIHRLMIGAATVFAVAITTIGAAALTWAADNPPTSLGSRPVCAFYIRDLSG
jgi:hypothetical protein